MLFGCKLRTFAGALSTMTAAGFELKSRHVSISLMSTAHGSIVKTSYLEVSYYQKDAAVCAIYK